MCSNLPWRSSPSPVIRVVKLHHEMSNVCLMGVGEASIKLIVDHWVNFSYLENPSFPKCCECGGYDGRLWAKTKRRLASNTALCSRTTFMGFTDREDGDDEVLVLMIVLAWICDFFLFSYEVCNMFILAFQTVMQFVMRFYGGVWCLRLIVAY